MGTNNGLGKQGGYVWAIVAIVAIIILVVIWSGKSNDTVSDTKDATSTDTATTSSTDGGVGSSSGSNTGAITKPTKATSANNQVPAPTVTRTSSGAYIIKYTSTGFAPTPLTITTGSSVHFTNNAAAAMRVSPADKVNSLYSGLSQSKSVGTGGTFDYTFVTPGVYGYYNDNNLSHTGIIIVH